MSETAKEKSHRLLIEGRLIVREVGLPSHPGRIVAECRGDSGSRYMLGYDPTTESWRCGCEARGICSHIRGLQLIVEPPRRVRP